MASNCNCKIPIRRHFFKVMMPDFRSKLSLPVAFYEQLNGDKAVVKSCQGLWHIKVSKCCKGLLYFEEGWEDFVKQHDLDVGDFVVFEHKGEMLFDALIFDSSSCEKEFPISISLAKKNKKKKIKIHTGQSPLDAAKSYSPKNPHFITTIGSSNQARAFLHIPEEFARSINLARSSILILRNPSRKLWPVKLYTRDTKSRDKMFEHILMKKGWDDFYAANKLKEGDVCLFEVDLTRKTSNTLIMDVHIFPSLI